MGRIEVPVEQIEALPALLGEVGRAQGAPAPARRPERDRGDERALRSGRGAGPEPHPPRRDGRSTTPPTSSASSPSSTPMPSRTSNSARAASPARYGGRLSSVIEIDMKEGNMKEFAAQGSLGLIASRLTLEGPIVQDKTSFMLSGRRTYIDLLTRPFLPEDERAGYYFYDLNAKLNHIFSPRDRLFLSVYAGDDRFGVGHAERQRRRLREQHRGRLRLGERDGGAALEPRPLPKSSSPTPPSPSPATGSRSTSRSASATATKGGGRPRT